MALSRAEQNRLKALREKAKTTKLGYAERAELADLQGREGRPAKKPAKKVAKAPAQPAGWRTADRAAVEEAKKEATTAPGSAAGTPAGTTPATPAAATAPVPAGPESASGGIATGSADTEKFVREQYGHMAWALDDEELGPILRKAAEEGWDANRLKGAVFQTNWFRRHGIKKMADQLGQVANSFLIPLSTWALESWAMKVVTGQVQPVEFRDAMKEQAKGLWGDFGGALDRGFSVEQVVDSYREGVARELEIAPETIDFRDPKWQRLVVRRDPESNRIVNPTISDAVTEVRTRDEYGWDRTKQARDQAANLSGELLRRMGFAA